MSEKFLNSDRISELWSAVKSALSGKQNTLTDGTGTTIQGSAVNVTTPVNGIVTQAEFDALPEVQKNTGMYVVKEDGDDGGGSNSNGEVYSTEEVRIGTWIDGRPLYRKVFLTKTLPTNTTGPLNGVSLQRDSEIIDFYGTISNLDVNKTGNYFKFPPENYNFYWSRPSVSGDLSIICPALSSGYGNKNLYLIVKYFKTSDEPEVTP